MAFNEVCLYPDSLKTVQKFSKFYEKSYTWLKNFKPASDKKTDLYEKAVGFLKNSNDVPTKIASEWIKSPLFISRQIEINSLVHQYDLLQTRVPS